MSGHPVPIENRFWCKVDKSAGPDACWPWKASIASSGYGQIVLNRRPTTAHRVALLLSGVEIPDGMFVLHRCDNRPCCNPAHLFVGTHTDNMRDMMAKGRNGAVTKPESFERGDRHYYRRRPELIRRGEAQSGAKLTEDLVRDIRRRHSSGETQTKIAADIGVSQAAVSAIVTRKRWGHVS